MYFPNRSARDIAVDKYWSDDGNEPSWHKEKEDGGMGGECEKDEEYIRVKRLQSGELLL